MPVDESNQTQADFWTAAGGLWTALRDRFDLQAGAHGLAAIDALAPTAGESIIDIGCGAGTSTLQLAERVGPTGSVHGLDISPTMIEGARAAAAAAGMSNVSFAVGDAMVEPFDGSADGVYSRFGVMFFSDATKAFANLLLALRPHGRMSFVAWQSPMTNEWASRPLMIAREFVDIPFGGDPTAPGPFSLADPERIRSILDDAGFTEVDVQPRESSVRLGVDIDDAVQFLSKLTPPVAALAENDPDRFAQLQARLRAELREWEGPDGVQAPSAVWIVTARRPG